MPKFIDTTGERTLAIGICGRCSRKFPIAQLFSDVNTPGLRVCVEDRDVLDPYRKGPRKPDQITVNQPRPDDSIATTSGSPVIIVSPN